MKKPLKELRFFTRKVAQEGIVLVKNNKGTLPILKGKVALFGRMQLQHYYSGTGSGGKVNLTDIENMIEVFSQYQQIDLNVDFINYYRKWEVKHPFDKGDGSWASEPWSQKETKISYELIKKYKRDEEVAIVIIGRTAGEDKDNQNKPGSYRLTATEIRLLLNVKEMYEKVVVILNTGNILDMTFFEENDFDTIVYFWHAGQDGMHGLAEIITGIISPSGKLPMTIAKSIEDYPKNRYNYKEKKIFYTEDIYVGYRYFNTFKKDRVLYPFGYGLSYTKFSYEVINLIKKETQIIVNLKTENIGDYKGKETFQVYLKHTNSNLGKPEKELVAFYKTKELDINETSQIKVEFDLKDFASFDDTNKIRENTELIEKGDYEVYVGTSSIELKFAGAFNIENHIFLRTNPYDIRPNDSFSRMVHKNGQIGFEKTNKRLNLPREEKKEVLPLSHKTYSLKELMNAKITLDEYISTLNKNDLSQIILGEGMYSPKVTPGTASAFGGVTDSLTDKGIPIFCCADGPSGIRMDNYGLATSIPIGTLLASTFNPELIEELYTLVGLEMNMYKIDLLLAPGMNIQKNPLNGRNFEYFSEDPLLTGIMASKTIKGLQNAGVDGVLKHFVLNNQETNRTKIDVYVSERALREIYLKGFKYAIDRGASAIMSSYNKINGTYAASNRDLLTTILRDEWNFKGIVMTDWWANLSDNSRIDTISMIKAQNDLYMVVDDATTHEHSILTSLEESDVMIPNLQRSAKNIISFIMLHNSRKEIPIDLSKYPIGEYQIKKEDEVSSTQFEMLERTNKVLNLNITDNLSYKVMVRMKMHETLKVTLSPEITDVGQNNISFFVNDELITMINIKKEQEVYTANIELKEGMNTIIIKLPKKTKINKIEL